MKLAVLRSISGILAVSFLALVCGCQTSTGIRVIDPKGETRELTPEEVDEMTGGTEPYLLQVGDQVQLTFNVRNIQEDEAPWDYKLEVGDNMEVRLSSDTTDPGTYVIDYGDVIGISFLNNWPLNMNRTVRPDGKISATEIGDVQPRASPRTSSKSGCPPCTGKPASSRAIPKSASTWTSRTSTARKHQPRCDDQAQWRISLPMFGARGQGFGTYGGQGFGNYCQRGRKSPEKPANRRACRIPEHQRRSRRHEYHRQSAYGRADLGAPHRL